MSQDNLDRQEQQEEVQPPVTTQDTISVTRPEFTFTTATSPLRTNRFVTNRRGSSAVKMLSEDYNLQDTDLPSRRASTPEKRNLRNSVVKLLEEQEFSRRFSAPEKLRSRRSSSIVKTLSEEQEEAEPTSRRSSRSGSIVKMTSEDNFADDELSRRSSRADCTEYEKRKNVRRGSSIVRTMSEEQHDSDKSTRSDSSERSENAEKYRKSIDNGYKHSLESISEYKTNIFASNQFYPTLDSPTLDCLSDFAQSIADNLHAAGSSNSSCSYLNLLESSSNDFQLTPRYDSDNRSGEWNYFWSNYNNLMNPNFSSPFLCPSNSVEDLSMESNCTAQIDKGGMEKIFITLDELNEAIHCSQRVTDILKDVLKRSEQRDEQEVSISNIHIL